jgi:ComF family protein
LVDEMLPITKKINLGRTLAKGILCETIPAPCAACGIDMPTRDGFCEACHSLLPFVLDDDRCPACGAENDGIFDVCSKCLKEDLRPWMNAVSVMRMEGLGGDLIHRFKYANETSLARPLGSLAASAISQSTIEAELIVPVPLHWSRALSRGYNQTKLLCGILAAKTGIPTRSILRRTRSTPKQASLGREKRKKNLIGAFALCGVESFTGCEILLVDDVFTTGSTLLAAAEVLTDAGVDKISVLTLLRA